MDSEREVGLNVLKAMIERDSAEIGSRSQEITLLLAQLRHRGTSAETCPARVMRSGKPFGKGTDGGERMRRVNTTYSFGKLAKRFGIAPRFEGVLLTSKMRCSSSV